MKKLKLDNFLKFMKDPNNNIDSLKSWGLMPNEDPTKTVDATMSKKSGNNKDTTGAYNY